MYQFIIYTGISGEGAAIKLKKRTLVRGSAAKNKTTL